ncbi:AbrB family transcriptional regulator [Sphingomonas sp. RT2P30]|uniref:AbrB/MazE/SpoVT family DNA-binding domain-containing protein n=1 Tax=Parasphingomonas halimpatiens TaxID=3096162 RepID=UPI002FC9FFC5
MRVVGWGKSLTLRLSRAMVDRLGLRRGDAIVVPTADGAARAVAREQALARLRAFRGLMPAAFRFDRDEANVR